MTLRSRYFAPFAAALLAAFVFGCESPEGEETDIGADVQTEADMEREADVETQTAESTFGPISLDVQTPEQARVGQETYYTVSVSNNSDEPVHQVVVTMLHVAQQQEGQQRPQQQGMQQQGQPQQQQMQRERQQPGMQAQQRNQQRAQQRQQDSQQPQQWRIGRLEAGETLRFRVPIIPQQSGTLAACFTIDYLPTVCTTMEVGRPELTLTRVFIDSEGNEVDQAYICEEIQARYVLRNQGSVATEDVVLYDELPQGLMTADGENVVQREVGSIDPGEEVSETIPLAAQRGGQFSNRAMARTGQLQAASEPSRLTILEPQVEFQFDGPRRAFLGEPVTYRLIIRNTGDAPVLRTRVNLDLPVDVEDIALGTQRAELDEEGLDIGELQPGETREIQLRFRAPEKGELTAQAVLDAYCVDEQAATAMTMVEGIPALRLEMVDLEDPVDVGDTTVYRIEVKNQGSAEDTNIRLQAELPEGVEFVEAEGDTEVTADGRMVNFAPIRSLDPGDIAAYEVQVRAQQEGRVQMRLRLMSDFLTTEVTESESTTLFGT